MKLKPSVPMELAADGFTIVVDPREQLPYSMTVRTKVGDVVTIPTVRQTLDTGDYSLLGWEDEVAVERKSLEDLIGCIGVGRDRFERELQRMLSYRSRIVVVEASWAAMNMGNWRSRVTVNSAVGSVTRWMEDGVPFHFAGSRPEAELFTARYLYKAASKRWRRCIDGFRPQLELEKSA